MWLICFCIYDAYLEMELDDKRKETEQLKRMRL